MVGLERILRSPCFDMASLICERETSVPLLEGEKSPVGFDLEKAGGIDG